MEGLGGTSGASHRGSHRRAHRGSSLRDPHSRRADAVEIDQIRRSAADLVGGLRSNLRNELLAKMVAGASISPDALAVELEPLAVAHHLHLQPARVDLSRLSIVAPWRLRRRGVETRFVIEDGRQEIDAKLASKIGLALRWFEEVKSGASIKAIAVRNGVTPDRVAQILRLAWLAPDSIDAVASGHQPERLTADAVFKSPHIPLWADQRSWAAGL